MIESVGAALEEQLQFKGVPAEPGAATGLMGTGKEERYRRICSQINLYSERIQQTYARFIQLSLATIGGFVWLKTQGNASNVADVLQIARWILPALAMFTLLELIIDKVGVVELPRRRSEAFQGGGFSTSTKSTQIS